MATQTKTRKAKKARATEADPIEAEAIPTRLVSPRVLEAIGVLLLVAATALFFALFTYNPGNPQENLVGPFGAFVASVLIGGIGAMGYVVAGAGAVGAGIVLVGRARWPRLAAWAGATSILVATTILAHLLGGSDAILGRPAGGVVGAFLAETMRGVIGPAGTALAALGILLVGLLGVAELSFAALLRNVSAGTRRLLSWSRGHLAAWLASRQVAKARQAEVLQDEHDRRVQAAAKLKDKERKLQEKLEEKKRLAVVKATAKAEERALAKIAAQDAKARIALELAEAAREEAEQRAQQEAESAAAAEAEAAAPSDPGQPSAPPSEAAADDTVAEGGSDSGLPWDLDDDAEAVAEAPVPDMSEGPAIIEANPERADESLLVGSGDEALQVVGRTIKRDWELPPLKLLDYDAQPIAPVDQLLLKEKALRLENKLRTYSVDGTVTAIRPGPVVTTYEYQPAPGVKVAKIAGLSDDIAMSMEARSVRIIAPIPGKGVVGIELPNDARETVYLKEIIAHDRFRRAKSLLTIALGKDVEGDAQVRNLQKMPHLLVAGTTGSGKSVSTNAMILSVLYKATPEQVKFIMVDPKMLELSLYEGIPHLLLPVVTDPKKASLALQWAVDEMERRYHLLSEFKVRNIEGFNKKLALLREQRERGASVTEIEEEAALEAQEEAVLDAEEVSDEASAADPTQADETNSTPPEVYADGDWIQDPWKDQDLPDELPYIVVLIDEFADLMCVAPRDVEMAVQRLAQKARAAGVHLIIATQRPSTDVITGVVKNNLPSRLSFRVASRHDSATIINAPGAENLLGMGDMLSLSHTAPTPERIHGAFVSEEEVQRVATFWKSQGKPQYDAAILKPREDDSAGGIDESEYDEMYDTAVQIVTETRRASISALQRRLRVGYNRAARMVEMMEREGIVSPATGPKGEREVLVREMDVDGPGRGAP